MRITRHLTLFKPTSLNQLLSIILLVTMIGNMFLLPAAAQAKPQTVLPPAVTSVVTGGERFMDAAPQALGRALQLAQRMDYISQTKLADLSEAVLIGARQDALATAQQAATAQGSVGAIVNGLTEADYEIQTAVDVDAGVADLNANGFDAELETALTDMGLRSGQIDELADEAAANFTVRHSPLPTETVTLLQNAGLTSAEINQIEQTLADYGLANDALSDRLAQFKASQEELSLVRTNALVIYLQLLTKQVFVRQLAGETGRDLTSAEVDEVVKDQLRLLIHLGYLDTLWGGNPDPDKGEGQWLFVERYSLRVAERLDALILETHNVGLVVDLLVALQIHSTALAALAGDAEYAKNEVDPLADFLQTLLGDNLPSVAGSQGYRHAAPPGWWDTALALGDYNPAAFSGYEPSLAPEAVAVAQKQAQERIKGLAYPLGSQTPPPGHNQAVMIFHTAPPNLPPGVMSVLNQIMGGSTPMEFIWETLTGESDNWWAIGGNITLSFIPIEGEILDLITLFTDPTMWGKAMSLIGLAASIMSDITEVCAVLGVVVPPALLALPAAVGSEAVDVGAAILKNVRRLVDDAVFAVIKKIPFEKALQLGADVLGHLARRAVESVGSWPGGDPAAILGIIQGVLHSVWDPFVALLKHYGAAGLNKLFTLGFDDGALLAGRVLKQSDEFKDTDKMIEGVAKIGDDLAEASIELSDEATQGLGKAVDDLGEAQARNLMDLDICPGNLAYLPKNGLASPLPMNDPSCILKWYNSLSEAHQTAYGTLAKRAGKTAVQNIITQYKDDALELITREGDDAARALPAMLEHFQADEMKRLMEYITSGRIEGSLKNALERIRSSHSLQGGIADLRGFIDVLDRRGYDRLEIMPSVGGAEAKVFRGNEVFGWEVKTADAPPTLNNMQNQILKANNQLKSLKVTGDVRLDWRPVDVMNSQFSEPASIANLIARSIIPDRNRSITYIEILWKNSNGTVMRTYANRLANGVLGEILTEPF